ncbi:hypothetical protein Tco_0453523 [Tanacetum coccineum]
MTILQFPFPSSKSFYVDSGNSTIDVVEDIPVDVPNFLPTHHPGARLSYPIVNFSLMLYGSFSHFLLIRLFRLLFSSVGMKTPYLIPAFQKYHSSKPDVSQKEWNFHEIQYLSYMNEIVNAKKHEYWLLVAQWKHTVLIMAQRKMMCRGYPNSISIEVGVLSMKSLAYRVFGVSLISHMDRKVQEEDINNRQKNQAKMTKTEHGMEKDCAKPWPKSTNAKSDQY